MNEQQPDFKLSSDSVAVMRVLEHVAIGEVVSYATISEAIGRDITKFRNALESARRAVQRDKQMIFDVVRGIGMARLNDSDIVDLSDKARAHVRRHARRTAKKLVCVNYEALSREKQTKHNAALSMFGVISELSSPGSVKRLEQRIEQTGSSLPAAKAALAALGTSI